MRHQPFDVLGHEQDVGVNEHQMRAITVQKLRSSGIPRRYDVGINLLTDNHVKRTRPEQVHDAFQKPRLHRAVRRRQGNEKFRLAHLDTDS